jgi:hypothetical protein
VENVVGFVFTPTGGATLLGDGSLTVNFGSHAVTGTFTNIEATNVLTDQTSVWNVIQVSATQSGNQLTGTTSQVPVPTTDFSINGGTGFFRGELYGPTATEAAGVWSLYDGSRTALGIFGAPRQ